MFQLKPISKDGIPEALQKAERYRLLNEPFLAESICEDILEIEPGNNQAIITMLLAITDQFGKFSSVHVHTARKLLPSLKTDYDRLYYAGIISERQGKAVLNQAATGFSHIAYAWLSEAMGYYEKAEAVRPPGNDDAILRWNTCARLIMKNKLAPRPEENMEPPLE